MQRPSRRFTGIWRERMSARQFHVTRESTVGKLLCRAATTLSRVHLAPFLVCKPENVLCIFLCIASFFSQSRTLPPGNRMKRDRSVWTRFYCTTENEGQFRFLNYTLKSRHWFANAMSHLLFGLLLLSKCSWNLQISVSGAFRTECSLYLHIKI